MSTRRRRRLEGGARLPLRHPPLPTAREAITLACRASEREAALSLATRACTHLQACALRIICGATAWCASPLNARIAHARTLDSSRKVVDTLPFCMHVHASTFPTPAHSALHSPYISCPTLHNCISPKSVAGVGSTRARWLLQADAQVGSDCGVESK